MITHLVLLCTFTQLSFGWDGDKAIFKNITLRRPSRSLSERRKISEDWGKPLCPPVNEFHGIYKIVIHAENAPFLQRGFFTSYCSVSHACRCISNLMETCHFVCVIKCPKSTPFGCCHVQGNQTLSLAYDKKKIILPKFEKVLTVPTGCKDLGKLVRSNDTYTSVLFSCWTDVKSNDAHIFCQPIPDIPDTKTHKHFPVHVCNTETMGNNTKTLSVNGIFTFAYLVSENSFGNCDLCFCNDFLPINGEGKMLLCPCAQTEPSPIYVVEGLALYVLIAAGCIMLLLSIIFFTYMIFPKKGKPGRRKPFSEWNTDTY